MKKTIVVILSLIMMFSFCVTFIGATKETSLSPEIYNALYDADISSLRKAIDLGMIKPSELTAYYLDRIEKYNSKWNCFITLCDDAMEQANKRDNELQNGNNQGKLFGIPVVVKDNIDVAGVPTTNGHKLTASSTYTPDKNATIVDKLLSEGAIIIGKTNMATDAQSARITKSFAVGETYNAYNVAMASGGSSGGSAVATSLNFAVLGLGTDTNSSLRIPSVLNGCLSLRTTRGLIDRDGIVILNEIRDTPGAITRTVKDQAIVLDVMTDSKYNFESNLNTTDVKKIKIGIIKELTYSTNLIGDRTKSKLDVEVQTVFAKAVEELKKIGVEVIEVSMPNLFDLKNNCVNNKTTEVEKYYLAFESLLSENGISAVIFPTYLSTPLETGVDEDGNSKANTGLFTNNSAMISPALGCPEISLTIGYHSLGPGIGMEIASLKGNDQLLLNIAYAYTNAYSHRVIPTDNGQPEGNVKTLSTLVYEFENPTQTETEEQTTVVDTEEDIPNENDENDNTEEKDISLDKIKDFLVVFIYIMISVIVILISIKYGKTDKKRTYHRRNKTNKK